MTALRTLLTGMAANSFKRVSLSSEETALANLLPRTRANFDGGSSFVDDAAVSAAIGGLTTPSTMSFSAAAISEIDGYNFFYGGGHTDSGDGSFYGFDLQAAAANINGSGSGTAWDLLVPSCQYLDSFTNGEPVWSSQTAVTVATGTGQSYWATTNKNSRHMPGDGHTYHTLKFMPSTKTVLLSNFGGFDPNANGTIGAPWCYDITGDTLTGPLAVTDNTGGFGPSVDFGYTQLCFSDGAASPVCPAADGNVYCPAGNSAPAFGSFVVRYTNPTNSGIAQDVTVSDGNSLSFSVMDGALITDPADPLDYVLVIHGLGTSTAYADNQLLIITGLRGHATPAFNFQTYASGSVTTNGKEYLALAPDSSRGVIWMTDGDNLFKITPNASLSGWTIAQVTGSSGDTPPTPPDTAHLPSLQYLPGDDCLIHSYVGRVAVYKPTGWSPPVSAFVPYNPWPQLGPTLAQ